MLSHGLESVHSSISEIKSTWRILHECLCFIKFINDLGKRDKMGGLPSILPLFRNELNKFNNTGARMLDSFYHMTFKLF